MHPFGELHRTGNDHGTTPLTGERAQAILRGRPRGRLGRTGSGNGCYRSDIKTDSKAGGKTRTIVDISEQNGREQKPPNPLRSL